MWQGLWEVIKDLCSPNQSLILKGQWLQPSLISNRIRQEWTAERKSKCLGETLTVGRHFSSLFENPPLQRYDQANFLVFLNSPQAIGGYSGFNPPRDKKSTAVTGGIFRLEHVCYSTAPGRERSRLNCGKEDSKQRPWKVRVSPAERHDDFISVPSSAPQACKGFRVPSQLWCSEC